MNAIEFQRIRKRLNLTQAEIAKEMKVTSRTIIRWESGDGDVPKLAELAIKRIRSERETA